MRPSDANDSRAVKSVVVTDGEQRSALALVRSLGHAGYRCVVTSGTGKSLAGASRFAALDIAVPNALERPAELARAMEQLVTRESPDVLIPTTEPSMLVALANRERLEPAVIPFPCEQAFRAISDKGQLMQCAAPLGIAIPAQHVVASYDDIEAVDSSAFRFPLVAKPSRSIGEYDGQRVKLGVRHVKTAAELRSELAAMPRAAFPVLLQQRVYGPGIGVFLLLWDGEVIATFLHRRLREKPPAGGVSVYRESIPIDESLVRRSRALLEKFRWRGVAMIEYKLDAATGTPYLMEINGRFWGSLQLAIDAGVDFPELLVRCARGEQVEPVTTYRSGVRSRWSWGEVDHVLARLRRSNAELNLPPDAPSLLRTLADFAVSPLRGSDRDEVFRLSDPKPFFRETALWLRGR
jgi:predicted ATP-grasp superfamily ATP-dependent carboligase